MIGFFTVEQSHATVLTRFGKITRVVGEGLHFRFPFEHEYRVNWGNTANRNNGREIELTEQVSDTSPKECHTNDNVPVTIDASVYWQIIDVRKALFEVDYLPKSLIDSCLNALRAEIGKLTLDQVLSTRKDLSSRVAEDLSDVAETWGVRIARVEIQELSTSSETEEAMRMEMAAERRRRANILEADGLAEAKKKTADAEAYAIRVRAEAEADYIKKLSESLGTEQVGQLLALEKALESYREIAQSPSSKVFLPSSINTLISDRIGQ